MSQVIERGGDFSTSGIARYTQLGSLFRRRIETGQWPQGAQIPTIDELAEEFGVARATIRQAIGLLEDEGLISRFRGRGTFVNAHPAERIWFNLDTDWQRLLTSREGAVIEVLERRVGPLRPPATPIGKVADSYLHLRRRHSLHGRPFLIADVAIEAELAAGLPEDAFTAMTALRLAQSLPGVKITRAGQSLTIGAADLETARALGVEVNSPICFIDREAADQKGRLVVLSRGAYRGDFIRIDWKVK